VSHDDRVLALSSLSFDLSVYDIFGLLSAGGTIVIPSTQALSPPDPSIWHDIMQSEALWNTVPAFMELLVCQLESADSRLPLRLIYLTGDWIPISLPRRIKALSANADLRIISLGGATEASIWSNIYEIDDVNTLNISSYIPLVKAMDLNIAVYVLDDGVMLSCDLFQFESIDHVAVTCLPVIESILMRPRNHQDHRIDDYLSNISAYDSAMAFILGEWSYGGVVAAAVPKPLQFHLHCIANK